MKLLRVYWIQSHQLDMSPKVETLTFTFLSSFTLLVASRAFAFKGAHCIDAVSSLAYPRNSLAFINICRKKGLWTQTPNFHNIYVYFFNVQKKLSCFQENAIRGTGPPLYAYVLIYINHVINLILVLGIFFWNFILKIHPCCIWTTNLA